MPVIPTTTTTMMDQSNNTTMTTMDDDKEQPSCALCQQPRVDVVFVGCSCQVHAVSGIDLVRNPFPKDGFGVLRQKSTRTLILVSFVFRFVPYHLDGVQQTHSRNSTLFLLHYHDSTIITALYSSEFHCQGINGYYNYQHDIR